MRLGRHTERRPVRKSNSLSSITFFGYLSHHGYTDLLVKKQIVTVISSVQQRAFPEGAAGGKRRRSLQAEDGSAPYLPIPVTPAFSPLTSCGYL